MNERILMVGGDGNVLFVAADSPRPVVLPGDAPVLMLFGGAAGPRGQKGDTGPAFSPTGTGFVRVTAGTYDDPPIEETGDGPVVRQEDPEIIMAETVTLSTVGGWKLRRISNTEVWLVVRGDDGFDYGTILNLGRIQ